MEGCKKMNYKGNNNQSVNLETCPICGSDLLNGICENCSPEEWDQEFVDQGGWK